MLLMCVELTIFFNSHQILQTFHQKVGSKIVISILTAMSIPFGYITFVVPVQNHERDFLDDDNNFSKIETGCALNRTPSIIPQKCLKEGLPLKCYGSA